VSVSVYSRTQALFLLLELRRNPGGSLKDAQKGDPKNNPILSITKLVVFPKFEKVKITRPEKFGGNLEFKNYEDLEKSFESGKLHALDLKNSVSGYLEKMIAPIRKVWK